MDSLIVIIALIFFAAGLAYGHGAGTLKGSAQVWARSPSPGPGWRDCCSCSC
jgi:p-aminobenzoyl-glutamate transporter AbgT